MLKKVYLVEAPTGDPLQTLAIVSGKKLHEVGAWLGAPTEEVTRTIHQMSRGARPVIINDEILSEAQECEAGHYHRQLRTRLVEVLGTIVGAGCQSVAFVAGPGVRSALRDVIEHHYGEQKAHCPQIVEVA